MVHTPTTPKQTTAVPADRLYSLVYSILTSPKYRVPDAHAETITNAMLAGDLTGHDTHGTQRLPSYLKRVRENVMDPTAYPVTTYPAAAVAAIDGCNAFGHVAVAAAIDASLDLAKQFGIGMAGVKRSNHFGSASWVIERAVNSGFAAIVFTNSSPALPPFGGKAKLLGVSPLAAGLPGSGLITGSQDSVEHVQPFILDMAPSVAARGKVIKALRRGELIPEGWALDSHGKPTTDPAAALQGTTLPMGGPKGSALAIMMDVFSGVMTGAAFAGAVASPYDASRPADVGHFVVVMKPDLFVSRTELNSRLKKLWLSVTESDCAADVSRIFFPGELEQLTRVERVANGIPFTHEEMDILNEEARKAEVETLLSYGSSPAE